MISRLAGDPGFHLNQLLSSIRLNLEAWLACTWKSRAVRPAYRNMMGRIDALANSMLLKKRGPTLKDLTEFEAMTGVPLIEPAAPIEKYKELPPPFSNTNPEIAFKIPESLSKELLQSGAYWTLGGKSGRPVVYWAIPVEMADRHGLDYIKEWWRCRTEDRGRYVLSECGHVVLIREAFRGKNTSMISTPHGFGVRSGHTRWFRILTNPEVFYHQPPRYLLDAIRKYRIFQEYEFSAEVEAFAAAFTAFGDPYMAYSVARRDAAVTPEKVNRMLKTEKVQRMVQERTRSAMEEALASRGMSEKSAEGYVIREYMDLVEKIKDAPTVDPKLLTILRETLGELGEYLDLKGERDVVTTTNTLQLGSGAGQVIAQQIEQKKQEMIEPAKVEEVESD